MSISLEEALARVELVPGDYVVRVNGLVVDVTIKPLPPDLRPIIVEGADPSKGVGADAPSQGRAE
jgi:hypothetical protein